jgi:pSer/pThr/pTyr-binding forkhead associated (FHA) protein/DNA-binding CsgD family transcriptional regulator
MTLYPSQESPGGENGAHEESTLPVGRVPAGTRSTPLLILAGTGNPEDSARDTVRMVVLGDRLVIGRKPGSDGPSITLDHPLISRVHAVISRAPNRGFDLTDLGSKNGTIVDETRAASRVPLLDGASIFMGGALLVLRFVSREELEALEEEQRSPFGPIPTLSSRLAMSLRSLRRDLARTACNPVLITGHAGMGRETYARAFHAAGRGKGDFFSVNGFDKGATVIGEVERFQRASDCYAAGEDTLFVKNVDALAPEVQERLAALLVRNRALIPTSTQRSGGGRLLAATSVESPRLLVDSLQQAFGPPVRLPELVARPEDVPSLIRFFLRNRHVAKLGGAILQTLFRRSLPLHSLRDLDSFIVEASLRAESDGSDVIATEYLPSEMFTRRRMRNHNSLENKLPAYAARYGLTPTEADVLLLAARDGSSVKEIAFHKGVSEKTVHSHWRSIYGKTGASSQLAVVAAVWGFGVVRSGFTARSI